MSELLLLRLAVVVVAAISTVYGWQIRHRAGNRMLVSGLLGWVFVAFVFFGAPVVSLFPPEVSLTLVRVAFALGVVVVCVAAVMILGRRRLRDGRGRASR